MAGDYLSRLLKGYLMHSDDIEFQKIDEFRPYNIVKIIPRINKLSRKVSGEKSDEQIIASNIGGLSEVIKDNVNVTRYWIYRHPIIALMATKKFNFIIIDTLRFRPGSTLVSGF